MLDTVDDFGDLEIGMFIVCGLFLCRHSVRCTEREVK